jgi:hypothetical protein
MNSAATFWAIAGFMAGLAAAFAVLRLWQTGAQSTLKRINGWVLASMVVIFAGALAIYAKVGQPQLLVDANNAAPAQSTEHAATSAANTSAGSMAEVTAKLAAKLAKGGGTDADWQLLQQSYEFIGDTAAASLAAQHKIADGATQSPVMSSNAASNEAATATDTKFSADIALYQQKVTANPKDAAAWRALAEAARSARQFSQANAAYAQLVKLKAMNADAWADYADAAASQGGSLANDTTRTALNAALKLNSKHPKALWLQASLLLEEKRYAEALKNWQRLRSVIADDSPDAKIIDANMVEAQSLATSPTSKQAATTTAAATAAVKGAVNVDASLSGKVAGMTLFVFAKAPDSAAPVAVYRVSLEPSATHWPVSFVLDDSQAMLPTRKLSNYTQVQVQARLSRSGQALAQVGDWQSEMVTVGTLQSKAVSLLIKQPVVVKAGT